MSDPYKILGVSQSASDEEIKQRYREISIAITSDGNNYDEKMNELNEAYDFIMNSRRGSGQAFGNIRDEIDNGNYDNAERMLEETKGVQSAEWFFLKGKVSYSKGWLNDAYANFERAVSLEPSNEEYNAFYNQMKQNAGGYMNGNPSQTVNNSKPFAETCCLTSGCLCTQCCCDCCAGTSC